MNGVVDDRYKRGFMEYSRKLFMKSNKVRPSIYPTPDTVKDMMADIRWIWNNRVHEKHVHIRNSSCMPFWTFKLYDVDIGFWVYTDTKYLYTFKYSIFDPDRLVPIYSARSIDTLSYSGKPSLLDKDFITDLIFLNDREFPVENRVTDVELFSKLSSLGAFK